MSELLDEGTANTETSEAVENEESKSLLSAENEQEEVVEEKDGEETEGTPEEDNKTEKSEAEGAPDEYEEFKLPEGFELVPEVAERFKEIAKGSNLSQKAAQDMVDLQTELASQTSQKMMEQWKEVQDTWAKDAKSDTEYGGDKLPENLAVAKKALDAFGNDKLREAIETTGMGNHPELIRFLWKVGQTIKEDDVMNEGGRSMSETDLAKRLYPTMTD